jgi:hypothetical protein
MSSQGNPPLPIPDQSMAITSSIMSQESFPTASAAYQSMSLSSLQAELMARHRRTSADDVSAPPKPVEVWCDPELGLLAHRLWCRLHPLPVQPLIPSGGHIW